jgi:hypothetical protein
MGVEAAMNDFVKYFKENMAAMNMPAPDSLFATGTKAKDTIAAIAGALKAFGGTATLGEIILTVPSLAAAGDYFVLYGAINASFYLGACIGSVAIAMQRSMFDGKQIVDFFLVGNEMVDDPELVHVGYREYKRVGGRLAY